MSEHTDIMIVRQLPVIEEHLLAIKHQAEKKTASALSLACTADTVKAVKRARADLNAEYRDLERKRIQVKSEILAPYEAFEAIYRACVTDVYGAADKQLAMKIREVEDELRAQKLREAEAWCDEYLDSKGITWIRFQHSGITTTLTESKKSLMSRCKAWADKIAEDIALIDTQERRAEIIVEYKKDTNVARAIAEVIDRHKKIDAEDQAAESRPDTKVQPSEPEEDFRPPEEIGADALEASSENQYEVSFRVIGTMAQMRSLKEFLKFGGYSYEQL